MNDTSGQKHEQINEISKRDGRAASEHQNGSDSWAESNHTAPGPEDLGFNKDRHLKQVSFATKNSSSANLRASSTSLSERSRSSLPLSKDAESPGILKHDTQTLYLQQEGAYLHKLRSDLLDDYNSSKLLTNSGDNDFSDIYTEEDDEADEELAGFGGVGTSFDDAYTDLSSSFKIVESGSYRGAKTQARLRERTEWQSMLTSVLTGEVFRSEKTRLKNTRILATTDLELWLELRAKVCGRSVAEQERTVNASKSLVAGVLDRVINFKIVSVESFAQAYTEVGELLDAVSRCEALWHSLKAMRNDVPTYNSKEFQSQLDALTTWYTISGSINSELDLLKKWTGNLDADPSATPSEDCASHGITTSLVERILRQDHALMNIFKMRVQTYQFPLIRRAREQSIQYATDFAAMGLPMFCYELEYIINFPVILIRESTETRLQLAKKLSSPTMSIIDQTIASFQQFMLLGLVLTSEYTDLLQPVFDKGWIVNKAETVSLNNTLLECIKFYLEVLVIKFLDGGKSSLSFFRSFKSIEQLEQHYLFLRDTCTLIEGGDISVAERFTSLQSRVLSRLLAYWDHQMVGPPSWNKIEVERWFAATIENIRNIQRKLLRFYKILRDAYGNAMEFRLPRPKMKSFMREVREHGFFLVFAGRSEREGVYTFASPELKDNPDVIVKLMQGFCRKKDAGSDSSTPASENQGTHGCLLIAVIEEPLLWDGEIFHLDSALAFGITSAFSDPGRVRLVVQGGSTELSEAHSCWTFLGALDQTVAHCSNLVRVDAELSRIRSLFYRLSSKVIISAPIFRRKAKPFGCHEIIQQMYVFAREFGQRGLHAISPSKRGKVAVNLIDLCVDWVSFVCDDCPPSEPKTFRWTVAALEFAMVMTRGVNIVVISEEKFTELRKKVADCVTLLISHFDIMGARSKAQKSRVKLIPKAQTNVALIDDDVTIASLREKMLEQLDALESQRSRKHMVGKVLDDTNTEFEFLNFASSNLSTAAMRWQQGRLIGSGAFGSVYEAQNLDSGEIMAVKEIRLQHHQSIGQILKNVKDEMSILEVLRHPNVVQYFGIEVHRERVFIFMEYCDNGSLARLLDYGRIEDETVTQMYSLQMLEGLAYLHQSGIVHRDIKPENILLDSMGVIKYVDFGAAKVIARSSTVVMNEQGREHNPSRMTSLMGTPMYMSPEIITGQHRGHHGSTDIWSMGCCILEMVTGRRPWSNLDNEWAIMYHIAANHTPTLPTNEQATPACQEFLIRTLERDPERRPGAMELLSDPWITSIRNQLLGLPAQSVELEQADD